MVPNRRIDRNARAQQPGKPEQPGNQPDLPDPDEPAPVEEPPPPIPVPPFGDEPPPMQVGFDRRPVSSGR